MRKEHIGFLISGAIGAVIGEIIGYAMFTIAVDLPFSYWLHHLGSHTWAIHGAAVGASAWWFVQYVNAVTKRGRGQDGQP